MATSSLSNSNKNNHARSKSLPSKPYPIIFSRVDEHSSRLRDGEASSSLSSSISGRLSELQHLQGSIEEVLELNLTKQAIFRHRNEAWVAALLLGSVRLLDLCGTAIDSLRESKEYVQGLRSILRRRRGGEMGISNELRKSLQSRKIIQRTVRLALKEMEKKQTDFKTNEIMGVMGILGEFESLSLNTIETLLLFIQGSKPSSKMIRGWSLVSKLVESKRLVRGDGEEEEKEEDRNEFSMVDSAMGRVISQKMSKSDYISQVENLQNWLGKLESAIDDIEQQVDNLYRNLVRTRVSLLNILNH